MAYIPNEVIDQIRHAVKIEDYIAQFVQLTKRGQGYSASCPFHEDRNPSFSIHTGKQIYKCFSCGRGGNIFSFVQEMESLSFVEAVKKVAEFANMTLDSAYFAGPVTPAIPKETQAIYDLYYKTGEFYQYYLTATENGSAAYEYLRGRGLQDSTIESFSLGLSPDNSDLLNTYLIDQGFSEDLLINSGIFYQTEEGALIDRFKGRLVFPLKDSNGKIMAFSGRIYLPDDPRKSKYVNSPETDLFHKSNLLYNLDQARGPIRKIKQALVCEGFMDVISLHDAGFQQVVATMGTALTQEHLSRLSKLCQEIIFVFDGDQAGQKATARAFDLVKTFPQVQAKAIVIPQAMDPDDWIKAKGKDSFQNLINQAQSAFAFNKDYQKQFFNLKDKQGLAAYLDQLLQDLNQVSSDLERQLYLQELAREYGMEEAFLQERMLRLRPKPETAKQEIKSTNRPVARPEIQVSALEVKSFKALQAEKIWLGALMFYPDSWQYIAQLNEMPFMYHDFAQSAFMALVEYYYQGNKLPLTGIIDTIQDTAVNSLLTTVMWDFEPLDYSQQLMEDCQLTIQRSFLEQEAKELRHASQQLIKQQDYSKANELVNRMLIIERKLKS